MAKALAGRIRAANEKMSQPGGVQTGPATAAAQPGTGASPAPIAASAAVPAESNGSGNGTKDKVRDFLVDTFDFLYTMKALTRFSVAVIGCPVNVRTAGRGTACDEVGGVKLVVFPSDRDEELRIRAYGHGPYSATVLRPRACGDSFAAAGEVQPGSRLVLRVPARGPVSIE